MKKEQRRLLCILAALLALLALPGAALAADLEISSAEQLAAFRDAVNGGQDYTGQTVTLTADIDLQGSESSQWTAIGTETNHFKGTFDGGNNTISGLYIDNTNANYQGLFGYVVGGTIKNLTVNGTVSAGSYVGGVVGALANGRIENCHNQATVTGSGGNGSIGGIVGYMLKGGTVENCTNEATGTVTGNRGGAGGIVGIVGDFNPNSTILYTVKNCHNLAEVSGTANIGGVAGQVKQYGTVENCTNQGDVSGSQDSIGGVVGKNGGTVKNCSNTSDVSSTSTNQYSDVGGVVGYNGGTMQNCHNIGNVSSNGNQFGGVVGEVGSNGTVKNCYNTGEVEGTHANGVVGGVVGNVYSGTVQNCYNIGNVSGSGSDVGGAVGKVESSGSVENCYYLKGCVTGGNNEGEAKTLAEFKDLNLGDEWKFDPFLGRPVLVAMPEPTLAAGNGTSEAPLAISSAEDLAWLRDKVNSGIDYEGIYFKLANDIELGGELGSSWEPIGNEDKPFKGIFDGKSHTISGLYVDDQNANYQGLFGYVNGGTIKNLTVDGTVNGGSHVGGVVGYCNKGMVENCHNKANVSGTANKNDGMIYGAMVGGVVGYLNGSSTVLGCTNTGEISGYTNTEEYYLGYVGGIAGWVDSDGTLQNCANSGKINSQSVYVGGIVGQFTSDSNTVQNCYNIGAVSGKSYVGGVAGDLSALDGSVENCYNTGAVSGDTEVGGVVGYVGGGTVENCYYNKDNYPAADSTNGVTGKTSAEFASGEVARLLQGQQTEQTDKVWGQKIGVDTFPVLLGNLSAEDKQALIVYTVKFTINDNTNKEFPQTKYANLGGTVELPSAPVQENYNFVGWRIDKDKPKFDETTPVSGNTVLLACYEEKYGANDQPGTSSATYGTAQTLNLAECVKFATGTATAGEFTYTIKNDGGLTGATINGDTLTVPNTAPAGTYQLTIKAHRENPEIVLLTAEMLDTKPFEFEVSITVNRKALAPAMLGEIAAQTYTGSAITPAITVTDGALLKDTDYSVAYANNTKVGTATVTVTGKGNYTGTLSKTFNIVEENQPGGGNNPGGSDNPGGGNNPGGSDNPSGGDKPGYYKITFDANGGYLVGMTDNTVYVKWYEPSYTMPNATMSGHTLTAWAIGDKDSANRVKANDVYTFTEDTTVYAIWQYNGGGGGGSSSRPSGGSGTTTPSGGTTTPGASQKPGDTNKPDGTGSSTVTAANINNKFADVQNNAWYSAAIAYVYNKGMMNGTEKGFEPNAATTRAMLVTMLHRLENEPAGGNMVFTDVAAGQWFSNAIAWATSQGIVNGYGNNTFAPNDFITREQLATILYRFAQFKGYDVSARGDLSSFSDSAQVSGWAREAMQWAVGAGIINGDNGALKPTGKATRAEVAMMLMRFCENIDK